MYGTVISAMPAEKFDMPIDRVRNTVGYWHVVNNGITAFVTPVVHFTNYFSKLMCKPTTSTAHEMKWKIIKKICAEKALK